MCVGGGQPEAPKNPAPFALKDAWKSFKMTKRQGSDVTDLNPKVDEPVRPPGAVPTVKTTDHAIRM